MSSAILELEPLEAMPTEPSTRTLPAHIHRIVLTGFMGSGKTTTGAHLAAQLGWRFADLDREIERRAGLSVPQIFAELGEPHFRRLETAALASLLGQRHLVLALGGGAPETLANRLLLEQTPHTAVVHLTAPLETLLARCAQDAANPTTTARPLLTEAHTKFHLRRPLYDQVATHTLDTATLTPESTTDAILRALITNH
jgi:shikimate kinase